MNTPFVCSGLKCLLNGTLAELGYHVGEHIRLKNVERCWRKKFRAVVMGGAGCSLCRELVYCPCMIRAARRVTIRRIPKTLDYEILNQNDGNEQYCD